MQKGKMFYAILAIAMCMLILVCLLIGQEQRTLLEDIGFYDTSQNMSLKPYWDADAGQYYLFLPGHVSVKDVRISCPLGRKAEISSGMKTYDSLAKVPLAKELILTVSTPFRTESYPLQVWQNAGIPTLWLEMNEGGLEYIHEDKEHEQKAVATLIDGNGNQTFRDTAMVSGRGNTTWHMDKKPYNLRFDQETDFGRVMGVQKVSLLANACDASQLKNALINYAARENGVPYVSEYEFVNLYVNGMYQGLYGVQSKDTYRAHVQEDGIRAAFEVVLWERSETTVATDSGLWLDVMYGDELEVQALANQLEAALYAEDWDQVYASIDVASFAQKYVLDEFFLNRDLTWHSSHYYYIDSDGVIHSMCAWDNDLALGYATNRYYNNAGNQISMYYDRNYTEKGLWTQTLFANGDFQEQVRKELKQHYSQAFCGKLDAFLERQIKQIAVSWKCDAIRWGLPGEDGTLEKYSQEFRELIRHRSAFLPDYFDNMEQYGVVTFHSWKYNLYQNVCVPLGASLTNYLNGDELLTIETEFPDFPGWYTEDGRTPYEIGIVEENLFFDDAYVPISQLAVEEIQQSEEALVTSVGPMAQEQTAEPLLKKLAPYGARILILGCFVFSFVIMLAMEVKRQLSVKKGEKDEISPRV